MRNDATEAALGLLGLNSALSSIPTIPLKRKQSSSSTPPLDNIPASASSDSISCMCGFTYDDGFSIGCDSCSRWCHAACFDIVETEVPEEWECWVCRPRHVDKERAVRLQKARQKAALMLDAQNKRRVSPGVEKKPRRTTVATEGGPNNKRKRRASVNVHPPPDEEQHIDIDEPWTHSYVPITKDIIPNLDTRDKLRIVASDWRGVTALSPSPTPLTPSSSTPAVLPPESFPRTSQITLHPIPNSSMSQPSLFSNANVLVRPPSYAVHAAHAIPSSDFIAPYTSTIIPSSTYLSDPLNAYAHLGMPKPFVHLFGPPLDVALDARIAGDKSRFVRNGCRPNAVLRPVVCARKKSKPRNSHPSESAPDDEETLTFGVFALRDLKAHEEIVLGWEWDDGSVVHHLPALIESPHIFPPHQLQHFRSQMTSMLHTLSSTFTTCACGSKARDCALTRMVEFVGSHTPPTPSPSPPSSFFKERRESMKSKDKANVHSSGTDKAAESEEHANTVDLGPLVGVERGFRTRERIPMSGGIGGVEMVPSSSPQQAGPSRMPYSKAHLSSTATITRRVVSVPGSCSNKGRNWKGKAKAIDDEIESSSSAVVSVHEESDDSERGPFQAQLAQDRPHRARRRVTIDVQAIKHSSRRHSLDVSMDVDEPAEEKMPPKMRKRWIHRSSEALREACSRAETCSPITTSRSSVTIEGDDRMDEDTDTFDAREMPPPPLPPSRTPPTLSLEEQISPSVSFAKLSLLSPVFSGPSPYISDNLPSAHSPKLENSSSCLKDGVEESKPDSAGMSSEQDSTLLGSPSVRRHRSPLHTISSSNATISPTPSSPKALLPLPPLDPMPASAPSIDVVVDSPEPAPVPSTPALPLPEPEIVVLPSPHDDSLATSDLPHVECVSLSESIVCGPDSDMPLSPPPPQPPPLPGTASSPPQVVSPPPPPPPPPTKVKLSLKDFALRKKKQREETAKSMLPPATTATSSVEPKAPSVATVSGSESLNVDMDIGRLERDSAEKDHSDEGPKVSEESPSVSQWEKAHVDVFMSSGDSLRAKVELVEEQIPNGLVAADCGVLDACPPATEAPDRVIAEFTAATACSSLQDDTLYARSRSKRHCVRTSPPRPLSEEDGEIFSPPPPKPPPFAPRSHSPPTQPRSFHSGDVSPLGRSSPAPVRRPLHPAPYRAHLQNAGSRPLPSAPRALRAPSYPPHLSMYPPSHSQNGPYHAPRGPSADRDRDRMDWERERAWIPGPSRGRGRGIGSWGR